MAPEISISTNGKKHFTIVELAGVVEQRRQCILKYIGLAVGSSSKTVCVCARALFTYITKYVVDILNSTFDVIIQLVIIPMYKWMLHVWERKFSFQKMMRY